MGDGWETARRLDRPAVLEVDEAGILQVPGSEWATFQLGALNGCWIECVYVDTLHFRGNFPDNVRVEYASKGDPSVWISLMERKKLGPNQTHEFKATDLLPQAKPASLVRITIAPDGGLSRVRILGTIA
uniref:Allantoate amidinohydrolase n=1 Tax=Anopheles maculatus TaxID=74869 RepID=A0A182S8C0_9DIPT